MVKIKRAIKRITLVLMICLACLAPIPILFRRKDNSTPILIEQLDEEEDDLKDDLKQLF